MGITFSDRHIRDDLQMWVDHWNTAGTRLVFHLFTNPFTPTDDTVVGDFAEAAFCGYSPQVENHWGNATEDEGNKRYFTVGDPLQWCASCTIPGCATVYGWFATREDDPTVLVASEETWPGGVQFCGACDCLTLQPTFTDQDVTPND